MSFLPATPRRTAFAGLRRKGILNRAPLRPITSYDLPAGPAPGILASHQPNRSTLANPLSRLTLRRTVCYFPASSVYQEERG